MPLTRNGVLVAPDPDLGWRVECRQHHRGGKRYGWTAARLTYREAMAIGKDAASANGLTLTVRRRKA